MLRSILRSELVLVFADSGMADNCSRLASVIPGARLVGDPEERVSIRDFVGTEAIRMTFSTSERGCKHIG